MIVIRVELEVATEQQEAFESHLQGEALSIRDRGGCVSFELCRCTRRADTYLLYEEWESLESFDSYRHSKEFSDSGAVLRTMLASKPSSAYYQCSPFE